ncbi:substrate-binding periplasmic protein [Kingella negevensis]|uniref:substrate-binding periplasmic protein n=3 Tax=Kingella negevensis TaxID=1522312 RepID=UPI000A26D3B3|nr:transporter substrate-binding domain-containing protein [Kingella negevensis]MDK4680544.1 transporter substrate-binding domain-containing protein [Kingella negevensis]MDK4684731.1 transporter substrate-binding domain-containing protein [Kingella negevensis]MDK4689931.1 transporter substrate-binding domain-containing protein [Kingella negevensis]MDK4692725.1 transporter substrate-binding domain-containing protein [Kingella negevensis]MDK4699024.1 transporter substrate-binding domain-containi
MKKLFLATLLVTSALLAGCGDNSAPETETPAASAAASQTANLETLTVGGEVSYEPYAFKDEKGQAQGFEVDVMNAIAKAAGMNAQFIDAPRGAAVETLNNGTFMAFSSAMSRAAYRLETMDMGQPYIDFDRALYVLDTPKTANLKTLADFKGKRIASHKSSKGNVKKIEEMGATPVLSDSFFLMLNDVAQGKADAAIGDKRIFQYYQVKYPETKSHIISTGEEKRQFSFGVKKGNTELLKKLDGGLEKIKADGTLDKIIEKWFGKQD